MIKTATLFSGYDSQFMALDVLSERNPQFSYERTFWCEIDPNAIALHNLAFPDCADRNIGDISKVDWEQVLHKYGSVDLLTYSFPCTDISQAGLQKGLSRDAETRSSLLWYCEGAIKHLRPRWLLMENVKALVSKKFLPDFLEWTKLLEHYGYRSWYKVMNAKDYGIPQNRERVFCVSCLDQFQKYEFPEPFPLETCLADVLEQEVDESYYLSDKAVEGFMRTSNDFTHNHNFCPKSPSSD